MGTVTLSDTIEISLRRAERAGVITSVTREGEAPGEVPEGPGNLAHIAAELFLERAGLQLEASIRLTKRIPAGAGLGGGSSDAAAVLRLMRAATRTDPGIEELARAIGSDVPFCLSGGIALVRGRGDLVTPLPRRQGLPVVLLLSPAVSISTSWAYATLDEKRTSLTPQTPVPDNLDPVPDWPEDHAFPTDLRNDFLPVVLNRFEELRDTMRLLESARCRNWGLSGKGPTFYALFGTGDEADRFISGAPERESLRLVKAHLTGPVPAGASSNW